MLRIQMLMFGRIRPEFQSLDVYAQNSNVRANKAGNSMFGRRRTEFQCVDG